MGLLLLLPLSRLSRDAAVAVIQGKLPAQVWMGRPVPGLPEGTWVALLLTVTVAGGSGASQLTVPEGKPGLALRSRAELEEMTVWGCFRKVK